MKKLHYKDICFLPRYSQLRSRKDAQVSVIFLGHQFRLPIIPSNMKCVIDESLAHWLSENNYFYVMHRFGVDNYEFVRNAQHWRTVSISVGVQQTDKDCLLKMAEDKIYPDFITIDIAHGHSILMKEMIEFIVNLQMPSKIIAGNVASISGYEDLCEWGADAVKVGIGQGGVCSTKNKTGFTFPMYSCINEISRFNMGTPIIADGGVKENGDIFKALHAGASMVMAGGIFSKLIDSPAELVNGQKVYYGSASQYNKKEYKNIEGLKKTIDLDNMTYKDKLIEIEQDLQSSVSYAGVNNISDLRSAKMLIVSSWEI
jgi:GMP reductase